MCIEAVNDNPSMNMNMNMNEEVYEEVNFGDDRPATAAAATVATAATAANTAAATVVFVTDAFTVVLF